MTWRTAMTVAALAAALGCGRSSTPADTTKSTPAARKDEVRLTGEEQRAAGIEVAAAVAGQQTEALRVPGRIALADDRTWRVGIRTDGVVVASFAGVGDYVKKGQVLARYHADEVRDSRALYRASQAELATSTARRSSWNSRPARRCSSNRPDRISKRHRRPSAAIKSKWTA